jgi:hypothetical protein
VTAYRFLVTTRRKKLLFERDYPALLLFGEASSEGAPLHKRKASDYCGKSRQT